MNMMLTTAQYQQQQAADMRESVLQTRVEQHARALGWLAYHTHDSRRSAAGFPDLVLVHARQGRTLYRELKTERGRVSREQTVWLDALATAGEDVEIWRPSDLLSGHVVDQLTPPPALDAEALDAGRTAADYVEHRLGISMAPWQREMLTRAIAGRTGGA